MRKIMGAILLAALLCMVLLCGSGVAQNELPTKHGPAPNAGDGDPDGSGYDRFDWPNDESPAKGPAPNAGDGIPDGSGF